MSILEKINDIYYRLVEQNWDELSKYKMSISGPDIEWIIAGSKSIGDYKLWFSFSITEHGKGQTLKVLLFNHCRYDKPVCICQKLVSCNNRTIKSAIEKLNTVLGAFSENYHKTGCYQLGISELAEVLKKAIR